MAAISMMDAWRRNDAKIAADAIALWKRLDALPANLDPAVRAKELCAAAYLGRELIGVSTMVLETLPQVRCRLGFFRCLVAPEHRQQGLARKLGIHSRALLAQWSEDNPREKVLGMATIVAPRLGAQAEQVPPPSTQNLAQCGWHSLTAPWSNMPPSARAASASVVPISKAGS